MGEDSKLDIKMYELEGSPIRKLYQSWFDNLAERIMLIMESDGINYKIIRKRKRSRHRSSYAERFYDKK